MFQFNLADLIRLLLLVCVFERAVCVQVFIFALAVCVRQVVVRHIFSCLHVRLLQMLLLLLLCVGDLVDPAPEAADSSVQRRGGGVRAAVTPGNDPHQDPSTRLLLTHQPAAGVALTTVAMEEAGVWGAACAQCAMAGEAVAIALLALP